MEFDEYRKCAVNVVPRGAHDQALAWDGVMELARWLPRRGRILEVGTNDGYALEVMAKLGFSLAVGCDIGEQHLGIARAKGRRVAMQDMTRLAFPDETFDAVYSSHTFEHGYDGYRAMSEVARVLKPGGVALIVVPDHEPMYGDVFVEADKVVPLEERPPDYYPSKAREVSGLDDPTCRNQFPFTMRLYLATVAHAGLDIQKIMRMERAGPEIWGVLMKPLSADNRPLPLLKRKRCVRLDEDVEGRLRAVVNGLTTRTRFVSEFRDPHEIPPSTSAESD